MKTEIIQKVVLACVLAVCSTVACAMHNEPDTRRVCEAFPPKDLCQKALNKVWRIKKKIENCCTDLDNKFDDLKGEIARINGCVISIPIATDAFTITQPGNYCLTADVAGPLTITADNVILDLNNHAVDGGTNGIVVDGQENVIIKNGRVQNCTNGIEFGTTTTTRSVAVDSIDFANNASAIVMSRTDGFRVSNCTVVNHSSDGFQFGVNTRNGIVRSSSIHDNPSTTEGIQINNCSDLMFYAVHVDANAVTLGWALQSSNNVFLNKCTANNNTASDFLTGFRLNTNNNQIFFVECTANNNTSPGGASGFTASTSSSECIFVNCIANSNSIVGFGNSGPRNCFVNCSANNNDRDGFSNIGDNCYFFSNKAIGNFNLGFQDFAVNTGWFANYAAKNVIPNYDGIPAANIKTYTLNNASLPANTVAWNNIEGV